MKQTTTEQKTTIPAFCAAFDHAEMRKMKLAIKTHFGRQGAYTKDGYKIFNSYEQLDECFGLAYTSSSSFAGLWVCNTEVYLDMGHIYKYIGFVLGVNGVPYALCWDKNENELVIQL